MKISARYIEFAMKFRSFLEEKDYHSPSDFHRDLVLHMGNSAPSLSSIWKAFYGARLLPMEVIFFMSQRYGFKISWRQVLPIKNTNGQTLKNTQMALPGMRELKGA